MNWNEIKTLKISKWLHKELKQFALTNDTTVTQVADEAIEVLLAAKGHKFKAKKKSQ